MNPPAETDLVTLLRNIQPELKAEPFVFCTCPPEQAKPHIPDALCMFREQEGVTLIMTQPQAEQAGFPSQEIWACVTLTVVSALSAVGFLATVSRRLADAGLSVNPVAGYFHDHLFVPWHRREQAMALIYALSAEAGEPSFSI